MLTRFAVPCACLLAAACSPASEPPPRTPAEVEGVLADPVPSNDASLGVDPSLRVEHVGSDRIPPPIYGGPAQVRLTFRMHNPTSQRFGYHGGARYVWQPLVEVRDTGSWVAPAPAARAHCGTGMDVACLEPGASVEFHRSMPVTQKHYEVRCGVMTFEGAPDERWGWSTAGPVHWSGPVPIGPSTGLEPD